MASSAPWPCDETTPCRPSRERPRARASEATEPEVSRILGRIRGGFESLSARLLYTSKPGCFAWFTSARLFGPLARERKGCVYFFSYSGLEFELIQTNMTQKPMLRVISFLFFFLIRMNGAAQQTLSTSETPGAGRGRARTGGKCFARRGESSHARTALTSA